MCGVFCFLFEWKRICAGFLAFVYMYNVLLLEIQLSRWESWDPVIKMGELGSGYQDGRVGIQLSRWESWDAVIKMGVLEIQLSRWESWDPVIKMGELESIYQDGRVGDPVIKMGELGSHIAH